MNENLKSFEYLRFVSIIIKNNIQLIIVLKLFDMHVLRFRSRLILIDWNPLFLPHVLKPSMDIVIRTGFQLIKHSIDFNPQGIAKGKALAEKHVVRVEEVAGISAEHRLIRCSVIRQTSVTLHPYKVQLEVRYLSDTLHFL